MPKLIIIAGTPGTGKSTLAKLIAKLGYVRLDLHHHYQQLSIGYNQKKQSYDIDYKKFEKLVKEKLKEHPKIVLDSHIAHLLPPKLVSTCIVLTCTNLKELKKRLQKRKYPLAKIRENLDSEIFQICLTEAQKHHPLVFDTAKLTSLQIFQKIKKNLK